MLCEGFTGTSGRNPLHKSKQILQDKLSKHDLNYLAVEKPGLIEKIINKGSNKIMDELNEATR